MKRNNEKKAKKNGWRKKVDENLKRGYKWFACLSYNLFKNKSLPSWTHKDNNIQNTIQSDSHVERKRAQKHFANGSNVGILFVNWSEFHVRKL